jgi:hypothetical protein
VTPRGPLGDYWENVYVRAPAANFSIRVENATSPGWFAFAAPRETGRLSLLALGLSKLGKYVFLSGFALYLAAVLIQHGLAGRSR